MECAYNFCMQRIVENLNEGVLSLPMAKVGYRMLPPSDRETLRKEFFQVMASLGIGKEVQEMVADVFKTSEIVMFTRRYRIGRLLVAGLPFTQIVKILRVGLDTIESIDEFLEGKLPNYRTVIPSTLERHHHDLSSKGRSSCRECRISLERHYPRHPLVLRLLLEHPTSR